MMSFCVVPWSASGADALLLGGDDVERQQPRGGGVDRHRRVHLAERDAVHQRGHVARDAPPVRRPCRPRRARARGRSRSRSASAGRTRPTARSGPWPGCAGTARSTSPRWSAPRRSASSTDGRARAADASYGNCLTRESIGPGRARVLVRRRCASQPSLGEYFCPGAGSADFPELERDAQGNRRAARRSARRLRPQSRRAFGVPGRLDRAPRLVRQPASSSEHDSCSASRPRSASRCRRTARVSSASPCTNACARPAGNSSAATASASGVGAVDPGQIQVSGGRERDLVLRAVADQPDHDRHAGRDRLERRGDRGQRRLVADHQMPVGAGIGVVGAGRAGEHQRVALLGAAAHGPAAPSSPWVTNSSVSRRGPGPTAGP